MTTKTATGTTCKRSRWRFAQAMLVVAGAAATGLAAFPALSASASPAHAKPATAPLAIPRASQALAQSAAADDHSHSISSLPVRVIHITSGREGATITIRGHWRMARLSRPPMRLVAPHTLRPASPHSTVQATSPFWSGYVDTGHNVAFRYVAANFTAPSVNCTASPLGTAGSEAGGSVGLDFWSNSDAAAVGYGEGCDSFGPYPFVWYQVCEPSCTGQAFYGVNPGDALNGGVYYNSSARQYQLTLTDLTQTSTGFSVDASGAGPNSSAEVVTYAPAGGPVAGTNLSDFGAIGYLNAAVTSRDGVRGNLASNSLWNSNNVTMTNSATGDKLATAGPLQGGTAFLDTWNAPY